MPPLSILLILVKRFDKDLRCTFCLIAVKNVLT
jgi:hypothetical protein